MARLYAESATSLWSQKLQVSTILMSQMSDDIVLIYLLLLLLFLKERTGKTFSGSASYPIRHATSSGY